MTQNAKPRATDQAAIIETRPPEIIDLLTQVDQLLRTDRAEQALAVVEGSGLRSPWVQNTRGVCLLRLGRTNQAIEVLRNLVFDPAGFAVRSDAHPVHQANYATALLLDGNTDGFFSILGGIQDRSHPAVARLDEAVRRWKAGMSWSQWLKSFLGVAADPPTLDFPPGDL